MTLATRNLADFEPTGVPLLNPRDGGHDRLEHWKFYPWPP
jgi:hypothetical protein